MILETGEKVSFGTAKKDRLACSLSSTNNPLEVSHAFLLCVVLGSKDLRDKA